MGRFVQVASDEALTSARAKVTHCNRFGECKLPQTSGLLNDTLVRPSLAPTGSGNPILVPCYKRGRQSILPNSLP